MYMCVCVCIYLYLYEYYSFNCFIVLFHKSTEFLKNKPLELILVNKITIK